MIFDWDTAPNSIGRRRLSPGLVSVLDNRQNLSEAIRQLYEYANVNREADRPRRGIAFRVVGERESHVIHQKICNAFDVKKRSDACAKFGIPVGQIHSIDDSFMSHACNSHAISAKGPAHLLLSLEDFQRIPDVIEPRHITNFTFVKERACIVYEWTSDQRTLVVVQDIQSRAGLSVKTVYKK